MYFPSVFPFHWLGDTEKSFGSFGVSEGSHLLKTAEIYPTDPALPTSRPTHAKVVNFILFKPLHFWDSFCCNWACALANTLNNGWTAGAGLVPHSAPFSESCSHYDLVLTQST